MNPFQLSLKLNDISSYVRFSKIEGKSFELIQVNHMKSRIDRIKLTSLISCFSQTVSSYTFQKKINWFVKFTFEVCCVLPSSHSVASSSVGPWFSLSLPL